MKDIASESVGIKSVSMSSFNNLVKVILHDEYSSYIFFMAFLSSSISVI